MSDFTDYAETSIVEWMSQNTGMPSAPTDLYVALHTSDPGESPDGTTEVSAPDYSRVAVTTGSGWTTITSGDAQGFENANEVDFGTTQNDWGTISHVSLWDGSSDTDNCLAAYALSSSGSAPSGVDVSFPAGNLSFTID